MFPTDPCGKTAQQMAPPPEPQQERPGTNPHIDLAVILGHLLHLVANLPDRKPFDPEWWQHLEALESVRRQLHESLGSDPGDVYSRHGPLYHRTESEVE